MFRYKNGYGIIRLWSYYKGTSAYTIRVSEMNCKLLITTKSRENVRETQTEGLEIAVEKINRQ